MIPIKDLGDGAALDVVITACMHEASENDIFTVYEKNGAIIDTFKWL